MKIIQSLKSMGFDLVRHSEFDGVYVYYKKRFWGVYSMNTVVNNSAALFENYTVIDAWYGDGILWG